MTSTDLSWPEQKTTAVIVLANGTIIEGTGAGFVGEAVGEVCFNTAMTGYQEILTDPSYAQQIVTFTFPHVGNTGTNSDDLEDLNPINRYGAVGAIFRAKITQPANYRSTEDFDAWLKGRGIVAITDVDTRELTNYIRENGAQNAVIAHSPDGNFDFTALLERVKRWSGLVNLDLAKEVTSGQSSSWAQLPWRQGVGYPSATQNEFHIVAIDYGIKRNILRLLAGLNARVTVVPAAVSADDILQLNPDGIFLSNGPGDPAATAHYAVPTIKRLIDAQLPIFGICLGHQLLALALGANTVKMHQGHHGANHPVKDLQSEKVEIVSMNHGFAVDRTSLPTDVEETHVSLFDGTNCGLRVKGRPIFSVQYHPEGSPGPEDSHYLFERFRDVIAQSRKVL